MSKEFHQTIWDEVVADDCRQLVRLAILEDLNRAHDWTTAALVPDDLEGSAAIVARQPGIVAGLPAAAVALDEMGTAVQWDPLCQDGQSIERGTAVARMSGLLRHLLTRERLVLNLLGRLSGIATLTRRYVDAVAGHRARIYDTRKTTPGWRRLEKYAVRCGGGCNHRTGLFDAALIKDNHLAVGAMAGHGSGFSPAAAVTRVRQFVAEAQAPGRQTEMIVEIEVDTLAQFEDALAASPDIVLLDNMPLQMLRRAVALRDRLAPGVELEASGNMHLARVARVAETGVTRISVGALTHAAVGLDLGLDVDGRTK